MTDAAPRSPSLILPLAAWLAVLALILVSPAVLNDGDTWWHIRAGQWMIDNRAVLHSDPWSYTLPGQPWSTHEWLSEVLMAGAYNLAGWAGVVALTALAAAKSAFLLTRALGKRLTGLGLAAVAVVAIACILALPLLILWADGLITARERETAPPWWMLAVMALWANLHGGYFFGLALIGPFALEALIAAQGSLIDRIKAVRGWIFFGLGALVAALMTPHGLDGLIFPFKLLILSALAGVQEWRAADFTHLEPLEIAILATVAVCLGRGVKVAPVRLAVLLLLLHMALQHGRHQLLLGVVGSLILAEPLARAMGQSLERPASLPGEIRRWTHSGFAIAIFHLGLVLVLVRLIAPVARVDGPSAPIAALAHVPADLRAQPVLNEYGMGGYLIWEGVKPFVDGRTDFYGDDFMRSYYAAAAPDKPALDELLDQWRVRWTMLSPASPLVAVMDQRPGWRRLYADRYAVVHVQN